MKLKSLRKCDACGKTKWVNAGSKKKRCKCGAFGFIIVEFKHGHLESRVARNARRK